MWKWRLSSNFGVHCCNLSVSQVLWIFFAVSMKEEQIKLYCQNLFFLMLFSTIKSTVLFSTIKSTFLSFSTHETSDFFPLLMIEVYFLHFYPLIPTQLFIHPSFFLIPIFRFDLWHNKQQQQQQKILSWEIIPFENHAFVTP